MTHQKGSGFQDFPEDIVVSWHAMSPSEVLEKLETAEKVGLTSQEAAARVEKYGLNQLEEKPRPTFFAMVIDQLRNFIVIMLIVAAVISFVLGDTIEGSAIMAIVILNAILGVVQESRAEEALAALKRMAAPEAQVLRDGNRINLPARELVPGDIVYLEAGNFIPADLRLLDAVNLRIDEAALTGESVPVQKVAVDVFTKDAGLGDRKNSAFMGTTVTYGRGLGVVTSTGMTTQLGLIAGMLQSVDEEQTPLQANLDQLGKTLGYACLVVCALVFGVGLVQSIGAIDVEVITELFMVAVSLAIAAVPEGLPAVVTISLAMGMSEMVKRHALIRRLASVETLGSATVICSDKTGTLTQNKMTVTRLWADGKMIEITGDGYNPTGDFYLDGKKIDLKDYPAALDTLWAGVLNNDSELKQATDEEGRSGYRLIGDPTEGSILVAGAKAGMFADSTNENYPRSAEIPFDSDRKRMVTVHQVASPQPEDTFIQQEGADKEWYAVAVKGAPDVVLRLCSSYESMDNKWMPLDDAARQRILDANDSMTGEALRVLGLAYRMQPTAPTQFDSAELEKDLCFVGLVGMIDPARLEVKPAMQNAAGAGIRTIMITGDYPNTAKAIAEDIGLLRPGHKVLTGHDLNEMSDEQLKSRGRSDRRVCPGFAGTQDAHR